MRSFEEALEEEVEELERYEQVYIDKAQFHLSRDDIHGFSMYAQRASQMRSQRQLIMRILAGER